MATNEDSAMSQIMQIQMALSQLLIRDGCTVLLFADGVDFCADVYFRGANISDGTGLSVYEALGNAVSELYPVKPGDLDAKLDEALEESNND